MNPGLQDHGLRTEGLSQAGAQKHEHLQTWWLTEAGSLDDTWGGLWENDGGDYDEFYKHYQ